MNPPGYPAARTAAHRVQPHFHRVITSAKESGTHAIATVPPVEIIEAIIDAAFWAGLRRIEGYTPTVSLAFVAPEQVRYPLMFEAAMPLASDPLVRVAPAVVRPGIHLGVWNETTPPIIWGAARTLPAYCFVVEVIAPGLIVVKQGRGDEPGKFVNVAVLEGDQIKVVDEGASALEGCPDLVTSLLGLDRIGHPSEHVNVLVQLAVSMRDHRRGGTLLVVPHGNNDWRDSIAWPVAYSVVPSYSPLRDLMTAEPTRRNERAWQDALRRALDVVGGLTAVDGATVITDRYDVLAFGAKIIRRWQSPQAGPILATEPIEGASAELVEANQLGGARHLSAAQFVHDQRDALALVASQDGRFTVFAWSECEGTVHAHRIETLLL